MSENWFTETCECGVVNWLYNGDLDDITRRDIEGFICYRCGKSHSFSDEIMLEMGIGDDPDSFELGLEKPE